MTITDRKLEEVQEEFLDAIAIKSDIKFDVNMLQLLAAEADKV